MKTLPISTYKEVDGKLITTVTLLRTCAENMPAGVGMDIAALRARSKVLDVLEKAEKEKATELVFEDADYETAKQCAKDTRWVKVEKHLLAFYDLLGI